MLDGNVSKTGAAVYICWPELWHSGDGGDGLWRAAVEMLKMLIDLKGFEVLQSLHQNPRGAETASTPKHRLMPSITK